MTEHHARDSFTVYAFVTLNVNSYLHFPFAFIREREPYYQFDWRLCMHQGYSGMVVNKIHYGLIV
jgi:hypothetical protein